MKTSHMSIIAKRNILTFITYMIRGGVRRDAGIQQVGDICFIWSIRGVGVCCIQNAIRPWRYTLRAERQISATTNQPKLANTLPILVYLPKLVLVAAFKFPKVTFPEANKNIAFHLLNRQLVKFLELFSRLFRFNCTRKFGSFLFDV